MPLDARVEAARLRKLYIEDPKQKSFRVLLTGETGSGKTYILRTARKPIHIDSFDPGGTKGLNDLIIKGDIVADTEYESELPTKPLAFKEWKRNFEYRVLNDYFSSFGTYCLDSSTQWAEAIMNQIMSDAKLVGKAPRWSHDYVPQKVEIRNWMKRILQLPCDVIITGHLASIKESKYIGGEEREIVTGLRYLTTGQGTVTIPLLFDELWVALAEARGNSTKYSILTQKQGLYLARTRIGKGEIFSIREEPDIKNMLKKAGWPYEDKPKLY